MSGPLLHSPADVLRRWLIANGHGADPATLPLGDWPVYAASEPDSPDQVLTVYDTAGRDLGRTMPDSVRTEMHGVQVRVRAPDHVTGYPKARAIAVALDQLYADSVTVGSDSYTIHDVVRTSDVLALGKEAGVSKRSLFTVNGLAWVVKN